MNGISLRRLFDFLAIVTVAVVLLALAWQFGQVASQTPIARGDVPTAAVESLADSPDLQLRLPLERIGMELSQEALPGDSAEAVALLERRCREVLAEADQWVLSLAISDEERQLLNSIADVSPVISQAGEAESPLPLFPLQHPTGRVGVREFSSRVGDAASQGRRLLCWGFILGEGTDAQTVWFARPREKLPGAGSQSFPQASTTTPIPSSREEGHAP